MIVSKLKLNEKMMIDPQKISEFNQTYLQQLVDQETGLKLNMPSHVKWDALIEQVMDFQIAIPSWALGTGGTRFGRFSIGGEPRDLREKIDDIALLHTITRQTQSVSLHIPWDIPDDPEKIRKHAESQGISFDAMNSNTFQDYGQQHSYRLGSLAHVRKDQREQAIAHNKEVIQIGKTLGSKGLTVWLADGSNFPGQQNFREAFSHTQSSLKEIYSYLPDDWKLLLEYKPYEPNFYSTVIPDWGTAYILCKSLGEKARVLVDLGHHLPNTNIEQIVGLLLHHQMLAGFHFNDSKYGDDDLTTGSVKPYQLFLIFCELVAGENQLWDSISWMIDASHNTKDPLEDLMQALENIAIAYVKALLVDRKTLSESQENGDVAMAQEILHSAYQTDVRPIVQSARLKAGGAVYPIRFYRHARYREQLIRDRGQSRSSGL
jgi:L-rhamnose isomerase / sugar isomerase